MVYGRNDRTEHSLHNGNMKSHKITNEDDPFTMFTESLFGLLKLRRRKVVISG